MLVPHGIIILYGGSTPVLRPNNASTNIVSLRDKCMAIHETYPSKQDDRTSYNRDIRTGVVDMRASTFVLRTKRDDKSANDPNKIVNGKEKNVTDSNKIISVSKKSSTVKKKS